MSTWKKGPKTVLMVSDDFLPAATGVGVHIQIVSRELIEQGFRVVVLTAKQKGQSTHETWNGVEVIRLSSVKIAGFHQALPNFKVIRDILANYEIEVVHYHYLSILMLAVHWCARRNHLPTIYTYHMTEDHLTQPWFMRPFRSLIKWGIVKFCNQVDQIISPSAQLKTRILGFGVHKPISYITNPVGFNEPTADLPGQTPSDHLKILFAGRLSPEKNIPLLLRAFALHLIDHPKSQLQLIGQGDQEQRLKDLAVHLGIHRQVQFCGYIPHGNLAGYYQNCSVFVLPSLIETQGIVAMEAMFFSKPVIVTEAIVSARELVEPDVTGFIVDAFAESNLADRLNALADAPDLGQRMGKAGRLRSRSYEPKNVIAQLEKVYRRSLGSDTPSIS